MQEGDARRNGGLHAFARPWLSLSRVKLETKSHRPRTAKKGEREKEREKEREYIYNFSNHMRYLSSIFILLWVLNEFNKGLERRLANYLITEHRLV